MMSAPATSWAMPEMRRASQNFARLMRPSKLKSSSPSSMCRMMTDAISENCACRRNSGSDPLDRIEREDVTRHVLADQHPCLLDDRVWRNGKIVLGWAGVRAARRVVARRAARTEIASRDLQQGGILGVTRNAGAIGADADQDRVGRFDRAMPVLRVRGLLPLLRAGIGHARADRRRGDELDHRGKRQ